MIRSEFLAGLAGLGGASTVAQVLPITQSLRVAIVAPESGDAASMGRQLVEGARAAVDEINRLRPSYNPYFLLDVHDDRNDVGNATVQANFAANNPEVIAVIGHLSAAPTLAALQTYANANVPLIVPTVTDDRVTAQGYRSVFRLPIKDSDEGALLAQYAIKVAGAKVPIVVGQPGPYGTQVSNGFVRRASALHVQATPFALPAEKPDDDALATQILAKTPDSITFAGTVATLGPLLAALRTKGYTGKIAAAQGFFDPQTVKTYAKEAEALIISTNVPYYPLAPTARQEVSDYQAQYGPLSPVSAYGYAAIQLVQSAAQRSGATNRLTLLRALTSTGTFDTITGAYMFGPYGDVIDPNCYFYAVRDGKFAYERQAHPSGFMLK
jgi:branched-chain amino acid transport system substrate-binding protein